MYRYIKRIADVVVALVLLLLLFPAMLAVALGVRITMGRPVVFRQKRLGKDERVFRILKFKSMRNAEGTDDVIFDNSRRVPPFGRFIRKTSLDELPQLLNVLRGDMSLIGPRPLFVEYQPFYTERERLRHSVSPGITASHR